MAITMTLVKFIMPDSVVSQTNLTYYLIIMTLLLLAAMLCKDSFP